MVVAIDGPAGTGKSSVSQAVARHTGFFYLNSGRFYRAITWKALAQGIAADDAPALIATADTIVITIDGDEFRVDGAARGAELHSEAVDAAVATVSAIPQIRTAVNERITRIADERDIIVEGRDMSTVVFPHAEVKIYLDADPAERARRRHQQNGGVGDLDAIQAAIEERDRIDTSKAVGRLQRAAEAVYLDTSGLTLDQVCERVIAIIHDKTNQAQE